VKSIEEIATAIALTHNTLLKTKTEAAVIPSRQYRVRWRKIYLTPIRVREDDWICLEKDTPLE
ncbi:MAG: hypothetical protein QXT66_05745, partial [Nitrososphaerota archaeon]